VRYPVFIPLPPNPPQPIEPIPQVQITPDGIYNYSISDTSFDVHLYFNDSTQIKITSAYRPLVFDSNYFFYSEPSNQPNTCVLTLIKVTNATATNGSLDITFTGVDNEPIYSFEAIPGSLDTYILANGDYADIAIPIIFEKLKKFVYTDTIFNNIQNNLSAFFVSIALEQRISNRIKSLVKKIVSGEINIEQFNELVQQGNGEFAGEYGTNYVNNYVKLQNAIDKYKYIVEKSIVKGGVMLM
jgi:hypothetical protein